MSPPVDPTADDLASRYMSGFGNTFETEALPGTLPIGRNSPQRPAHGLYAEQLSGSAFTAPRNANRRTWLYRIHPTVGHARRFSPTPADAWRTAPNVGDARPVISQLRWSPPQMASAGRNFVQSLFTMTTCGDVDAQIGMSSHLALFDRSMETDYLVNADAEMLFIPQQGRIGIRTELGRLEIGPGEIAVVPRGVTMAVDALDGETRTYVCENYGHMFTLPERGPIGANGLANSRDFLTPVAWYEDVAVAGHIYLRSGGALYVAPADRSPFDVVGWHGNYAPYKYDLRRFMAVGALNFDHPDPSIYTVLTSPSESPGTANVDLVIFPERWQVSEDTFRPPWYHRNFMSEFMGLIYGVYDAKPDGFRPGGMSLHNMMSPHGPDISAYQKATNAELTPTKIENSLAFMLETRWVQKVTSRAAALDELDHGYADGWRDLPRSFSAQPSSPDSES